MKNKKAIGIIGISSLILAIALFLFIKKPYTSISKENVTGAPTEVVQDLIKWDDPAGFSFQYPKELQVNKHDEDQENYAHLEFSSATHPGKLIIWAKDTIYTDVNVWVGKEPALQDSVSVDSQLGKEPAKKIILNSPTKKYIAGAITDQILFTVEAEPIGDDTFWQKTYEGIVTSFAFTPLSDGSIQDTGEADINNAPSYDEEEVIE